MIPSFKTKFDHIFTVITLLTFSLLIFSADRGRAELVDRIVAIVNEDIITLSELNEESREIEEKIMLSVPYEDQTEAIEEARETALNSLIDKKLIDQSAKEARVSVSDAEVDKALYDVRRKASMSEEQFSNELTRAGFSLNTYRDNLRSQLLQRKIVKTDIRSKIVITDSMIKEYYDNKYTVATKSDEFYLLQIGVKWKKGEDDAATKKEKNKALNRIKRIHNLAVNGENFGSLAEEYSDFPSAQDKGDIGSFTLDDMGDAMRSAVSSLSNGEISKIIETPAGYQFFKLISSAGGKAVTKAPLKDVEDDIKAKLFEQEMQAAFKEWVTELKNDAYIQKL